MAAAAATEETFQPGAKRHKKGKPLTVALALSKISIGDLRRVARRGGVKRIEKKSADEFRGILKHYLEKTMHDAVLYAQNEKRKTITVDDIKHALERRGQKLYI